MNSKFEYKSIPIACTTALRVKVLFRAQSQKKYFILYRFPCSYRARTIFIRYSRFMSELYSTWQQMVRESVYLFLARYTNCSKYIQKEKRHSRKNSINSLSSKFVCLFCSKIYKFKSRIHHAILIRRIVIVVYH